MNAKNSDSASVPVDYSAVHWFQKVNMRKSDKSFGNPLSDLNYRIETDEATGEEKIVNATKDGLVYALRNGWKQRLGAITVERATKETAARAIEDRKQRIAALKQTESDLPLAVTLEAVWFPNGKPAPVEWIANDCYRRSIGIQGVLLRRRRDNPEGWDKTYVIFVVPTVYGSDTKGQVAKLDDHMEENLGKDVGRKLMQPVDYFQYALERRRLTSTFRESDLVKLGLKRGEAQRAFALVQIEIEFPELNLAARSVLPITYDDKGKPKYTYVPLKSYVDVQRLRHADLVRLKNGLYPVIKEEKKIPGGRPGKLKEMEKYIRDAMEGSKVNALTATKIMEAATNSPVHLLQALAKKWNRNDADFAASLTKHAAKINKALSFLEDEDKDYTAVLADEASAEESEAETADSK